MSQSIAAKTPGKRELIKQRLCQWIDEQGLKSGERLLPQTQLADIFDTTEVTMHRVLTELAEQGVVYRLKGRGTFVNTQEPEPTTGTVCFVLPGHNLDKPQANPRAWLSVQTLIRSFVQYAIDGQPFTVHGVTEKDDHEAEAEAVEQYAAVFFHYSQEPRPFIDLLIRRGRVPVVCMGRPHPDMPCLTIDHDRFAGSRRIIDHLVATGYRRIGLLASDATFGQVMVAGHAMALHEAGIELDPQWVQRCDDARDDMTHTIDAARRLVDIGCDTILTDTDLRALEVHRYLRSQHIAVPGDIGLAGYDGLDWAVYHPPHLTTLEIPWTGLIADAMQEIRNANRRQTPHKHLERIGHVVPGQTTSNPAVTSTA